MTANGGLGGDGGYVGTQQNIRDGGGDGGDGGNGGSASATVLGSISYTAQEPFAFSAAHVPVLGGQAVLVESIGGSGGFGRAAANTIVGDGGDGGLAGAGGNASLTLGSSTETGTILAEGPYTNGAVVQSIGGGGGSGGGTSLDLVGVGGQGNTGGDGGAVTVTLDNVLVRVGDVSGLGSSALIAQSIGGGGTGGDASGVSVGLGAELGGNGGRGGNGGPVTINLGQNSVFASLDKMGGDAILAQSIGGAGGNGGNASSSGTGIVTLVIGGAGGNGGGGGAVQINTGALVTSYGDHAVGILAQSIGGGGGNGGTGVSFNAGVSLSSSVSVGGGGGAGGAGGDVSLTNTGQVTTYGPDSSGLLMQSIGGGGGTGGTAEALATLLQSPGLPKVTLIDEPEVSLHPEMLRILTELMREASSRTQLIVATHSDRLARFLRPEELIVCDLDETGGMTTQWADTLDLKSWLEDYTLDQLWSQGILGGRS